jgi:surface antigen
LSCCSPCPRCTCRDDAASADDDYPWRLSQRPPADAFGFTTAQCVSFVAWRLAQRGTRSTTPARAGATPDLGRRRPRLGHRAAAGRSSAPSRTGTRTSAARSTPAAAAAGRHGAGAYGHVAWVQHVHTDGSASVAHYNGAGTRTFSTSG